MERLGAAEGADIALTFFKGPGRSSVYLEADDVLRDGDDYECAQRSARRELIVPYGANLRDDSSRARSTSPVAHPMANDGKQLCGT